MTHAELREFFDGYFSEKELPAADLLQAMVQALPEYTEAYRHLRSIIQLAESFATREGL
jgi:hypothetical protein